MLDSETKRRIDTCRDILVGKVPDPKSQVEQITVALIYKFMDDMDLESEELGGARRFFTGDFERYRWAKLVAPGVSGQEMLNTYSEALTKMVENERLPELFRSIFRNAYLPYRDPETLRTFLREIDGFTYDHSERLGDAFEYLLSVLGSQGDAGQFRTPRHIIDFMVEIIAPKKNEVILDPACGTAGFLISAYKYILKTNSTSVASSNGVAEETDAAEQALESPLRFSGDLLNADDRQRLAENIKGYDISPDMVRLSLVNLYLHGFANPKVEEYDTLTSEEKWTEMADVILANPPFMSPKGGIKPHTRFQVQSKRSEVLFVDYIAEHLTPNGRAAVIVPEGVIFQSQSAYVELRKMLVEKFLAAVVSLPAGVFNPYSGVKTSILVLDRAVAKASRHVAFFKVENDGFQLGAQRKAQKGSQLPRVKAELSEWLREARAGGGGGLETPLGNAYEREKIAEGGAYNLSAERYGKEKVRTSTFDYRPLRDFCDVSAGNPAPQGDKYFEGGSLPFVRTSDVGQVRRSIRFSGSADKLTPEAISELRLRLFPAGTILFPKSGASTFLNHRALLAEPAYVSSHLACITPRQDAAIPDFVYYMLCHVDARNLVPDQAYPSLRLEALCDLEIPMPPLEVQREFVAEIERYQRLIDGARAVVNNYQPHIPLDPEWPIVSMGEIAEFKNGLNFARSEGGEPLRIVGVGDFQSNWVVPPEKLSAVPLDIPVGADYLLQPGDIVFVRSNGNAELVGRSMLVPDDIGRASFSGFTIRARFDRTRVNPRYFAHFFKTPTFVERMKSTGQGANIRNLSQSILAELKIPLPDLETQEGIIAEIETEYALVDGSRDLIGRFEKKIDAAIARVWGAASAEESA
jgi:type I restriction enzyme M protein